MRFVNLPLVGLTLSMLWLVNSPTVLGRGNMLEQIRQHAQDYLSAQHTEDAARVKIRVTPLDKRLRLHPCEMHLEAFLPNGARALGNTSVGVRCTDPEPWTVYLQAKVQKFAQVLVAKRPLDRKQILNAADVRFEYRDLATLPGGYETTIDRILGKQLQRALPLGAVISPRALTQPKIIKRGERVTILMRQKGMEISSIGIALADAALGDQLRVRNESSQKVIEGTVIAAHQIEVKP